ncbi:MAG: hypothetical protein N4A49_06765 [Marinifilaceae bacterium]|jgi:hypothetical protein|nr:hypothetical protein [Marinifilaceae bacterium]
MIKINFDTYLKIQLPFSLRRKKFIAFLNSLLYPIKYLYSNDFENYRSRSSYLAQINGQVYSIQEHLNNEMDSKNRNIQIIHNRSSGLHLSLISEAYKTAYLSLISEGDGSFIALEGEEQENLDAGFIVLMPKYINEDRLRAIIMDFKLAGKSFKIETN